MNEPIEAFPLQWPQGFERSKTKKDSAFKCTIAQGRDDVNNEIRKLRGTAVVISSNIPLKKNGDLYGSMKPVDGDHGVAVYFTWKNQQYVLACDNYYTIQENLRAIAKSIDAIRGLERWGASDILARAFSGFKSLTQETPLPFEVTKENYRTLAKKYHPDNSETGDSEMFIKIKKAYDLQTQ